MAPDQLAAYAVNRIDMALAAEEEGDLDSSHNSLSMAIDDTQDIVRELLRSSEVDRRACTECVRAIALLGSAAYAPKVRAQRIGLARELLCRSFPRPTERCAAPSPNDHAMSLCA